MNNQKFKTTNNSTGRTLPEGILCDGYCYECQNCVSSKYNFSDWWCLEHDRAVYNRSEYHACCTK